MWVAQQHGRVKIDKYLRHFIGSSPSMIHSFLFFFLLQILSKSPTRFQQSWQRVKAIKLSREIPVEKVEK